MSNSTLSLHQKRVFKDGSVLEMKMWEVRKTKAYPDGVRYSLIFIKLRLNKKVLMDNHSPKGHHYHLDDQEFDYNYSNMDQLIDDFRALVKIHLGEKI